MIQLKSITSLRPCVLISILVFFVTIIIFINGVVADDEYKEIIQDLPAASDFDSYLSALEMAVEFCRSHQYFVDLNLQFGLFLIDVNLRHVLQQKRTRIPANTRSRLEKLFVKNDEVNNYFHLTIQKNQNVTNLGTSIKCKIFLFALLVFVLVSRLFYNATTWKKPVDKFNLDLLNQTTMYSPKEFEKIYGTWEKYFINVNNHEANRPSPGESDKCLAAMVRAPLRLNRRSQANCLTPPRCKQLLETGSEFGYGLTHRLLYLIIARFSRRCVVFSEKKDKFLTDMVCKKCFGEAQFIASNSFQHLDLFYEHIALCGILGHAQFIQNYWLKTLLNLQIPEGCFSSKVVSEDSHETLMEMDEDKIWQIERIADIMNGQCNAHFTALAAATLSHALRYIIETQY